MTTALCTVDIVSPVCQMTHLDPALAHQTGLDQCVMLGRLCLHSLCLTAQEKEYLVKKGDVVKKLQQENTALELTVHSEAKDTVTEEVRIQHLCVECGPSAS
ncbi:hypothetical protein E2C01_027039 [Portunus trituberculatus]|uniref:Uncharacterized protein n=1 Tax=Portunus trituberculatus TaxID=210409 RepID=A0A5B7EHQ9_PORTR|nr:hypothetical protein [Portunus trituberculatus]